MAALDALSPPAVSLSNNGSINLASNSIVQVPAVVTVEKVVDRIEYGHSYDYSGARGSC